MFVFYVEFVSHQRMDIKLYMSALTCLVNETYIICYFRVSHMS